MRRRCGRLRTGAYPAARGRTRRGPGPACVMRAQRDAVRLTSRRASPARRNPPALDSCELTWRNASPGDLTKTTPPGVGGLADGAPGPGPHPAPPRRGARGTARPARPRTIGSEPAPPPAETRPSAPSGIPTTARAGSVSGADGPWTKRTATGAEPRTRSHCAPPTPSNPPYPRPGRLTVRGSAAGEARGGQDVRGAAGPVLTRPATSAAGAEASTSAPAVEAVVSAPGAYDGALAGEGDDPLLEQTAGPQTSAGTPNPGRTRHRTPRHDNPGDDGRAGNRNTGHSSRRDRTHVTLPVAVEPRKSAGAITSPNPPTADTHPDRVILFQGARRQRPVHRLRRGWPAGGGRVGHLRPARLPPQRPPCPHQGARGGGRHRPARARPAHRRRRRPGRQDRRLPAAGPRPDRRRRAPGGLELGGPHGRRPVRARQPHRGRRPQPHPAGRHHRGRQRPVPLDGKVRAFGAHVVDVDAHDHEALLDAFGAAPVEPGGPTFIVAHSHKGHPISFMSDSAPWHHKLPDEAQTSRAREPLA